MYQALYRKWRPRTFDDVVGQEHVSETLRRQVRSGRLSHAYLFVGTRGTGKTTCARILAKAINCLSPADGNPCNKCASCVGIDNGSILDVTELDAASNNGVDNVRALREEAVFTPVDVGKRVYIIDEVHMLSTAAFNALLKILEEPPEHLVFVLATTELHKVPATILSRCQHFTFKRALPEHIKTLLRSVAEQEGIALSVDAAALLARLADGSFRDALSLLDQCAAGGEVDYARVVSAVGLAGSDETAAILTAAAASDVAGALTVLNRLYNDGKVMSAVLGSLQDLIRDILLVSLMPKGGPGLLSGGFDDGALRRFAGLLTPARLLDMSDILRQALLELSRDTGGKTAAELCLIRLCDWRCGAPVSGGFQPDISALAGRVADLEKRLENGAGQTKGAPEAEADPPPRIPAAAAEIIPAAKPEAPVPENPPAAPKPGINNTAAQEDASPPAAGSPGDIWADILALIKPGIDAPVYPVLANQVTAAVDGNALVFSARIPFAVELLNKAEINAAIRSAIPRAAGKNLLMRVELDSANAAGAVSKLDALKKFDNIKFE